MSSLQEIQKGVAKVDWGRMADGKPSAEKIIVTHSGEPFLSKEKLGPMSGEKVRYGCTVGGSITEFIESGDTVWLYMRLL